MAAVAARYARALAELIAKTNLDPVASVSQLRTVAGALESSRELRAVWESPAILTEQKLKVLDALVAKAGISERVLRNFMAVLIDQERTALLPEIVTQVEQQIHARLGQIEAEIVSSRELAPEQRTQLLGELARLTGKTVLPRYSTDSSLLGGVTVRVGSTIYDGSVRGQLERMRRQLTES